MRTNGAAPKPFFEATPSMGERRLLLISYHFPPGTGAGALRWEKLSAHAAKRGWAMDVVTLDPTSISAPDMSRLEDLPAGIRVYGIPNVNVALEKFASTAMRLVRGLRRRRPQTAVGQRMEQKQAPTVRPQSLHREEIQWRSGGRRSVVRAYNAYIIHARQAEWARQAAALAGRLARSMPYAAVITCGPPHMVHVAGQKVAQTSHVPHIMDMRDPWSLVERLPEGMASPLWLQLTEWYERRTIATAARIVTNTDPFRVALAARYPAAANRLLTVNNGCDVEAVEAPAERQRFVIAYAGSIYLDRDPRPLFRAAADVIKDLRLTPEQFGIEFMGNVHSFGGATLDALARDEGLDGYVTIHPPHPRAEMMEFLARAMMLVSLPQDSDMAIPSKIFEYMQFDAWLLALAEAGTATELLLRDSTADVVGPGDLDGITRILRERYLQHARGELPRRLSDEPRFTRHAQAQILLDAIEEVVTTGAG